LGTLRRPEHHMRAAAARQTNTEEAVKDAADFAVGHAAYAWGH
jgi:hypothetical protein